MSVSPARRVDGALVTAFVLLGFSVVWFGTGLVTVHEHPWAGWLPLPVLAALAARACWRVARRSPLPVPERRFWRHLAICVTVLVGAVVSNAYDAVGGAAPSLRLSPVTMVAYLMISGTVVWSLLRLPTWQRTRGDWVRLVLDAGIVMITIAIVGYHFTADGLRVMAAQSGSLVPAISMTLFAGVSMCAFLKVMFAGAGRIDRGSLMILAGGTALAGLSGGFAPVLSDKPYLSTSLLAVPLAAVTAHLAAARQLRRTPVDSPRARGKITALPYVAVAGIDALLLFGTDVTATTDGALIATSAVLISALAAVRQITALRENRRLLDTVDGTLRQLRAYQQELAHRVDHDGLTQTASRSRFEERVRARLAAGGGFHVALLDLDDFKVVNDRLGHETGDALLQAMSRRLLNRMADGDTVSRLGGDEFTLLLAGRSDAAAEDFLRDLVADVQRPLQLNGHEMTLRISVGVTSSEPGDTPEELVRRADVAMYAAKSTGGGRFTWFDPIMDRLAGLEARLAADLRQAVTRGELSVVYQPIVELPHGRLAGVEALVRWRHPEHGDVSPAVFIPLAERNGSILEIGDWVLRQVVDQAAAWERDFGDAAPAKISVNISARQLHEPGFPAGVAGLLRRARLAPGRLVAEITETAVIGTDAALAAVQELHDLGLPVALDDFGTGQSSLSLLVDCPVNWLKVDRSFVGGITAAGPQAVIVDGLIPIIDGLRIQAVAEGVETKAQADRLHAAGYRYAQGFHFARPMPGAEIGELLVPARG